MPKKPKKAPRKPWAASRKVLRIGGKVQRSVDTPLQATAAALGALLSAGASPTGAALAVGGTTGAAGLLSGSFKFLMALVADRWRIWYAAYTEGQGDPELVEAQLWVDAQEPIIQELVVENARAVAEALTASVVPVLARLTREYRSAGRAPDAFFRGMRRLLSDLSEEEFVAFRDLIIGIADLKISPKPGTLELVILEVAGKGIFRANFEDVASGASASADIDFVPFAVRLFQLLKAHGVGTDGLGRFGIAPRDSVGIDLHTPRRIRALFK
jgi:hypothetical protein